MMLAALEVRDSDVLALARLLRQSGSIDTAERLERAYDVETTLLGLTLTERDEILRALEDAPAPLATLRGQLLRDRERWVREELAQRRIAFDDFGIQDRDVPTVRVVETSTASPEDVLTAARDFSPRRAELWRDVYLEHLTVHDRGKTWADVTEGNPWPIGLVWERLRYDWSEPGSLKGNVVESNIFKAGSTWEVRATRAEDGGSRVEIIGVRHLRGRGWLLWPFFPLGLARRDVADYLRKFLAKVEATDQQWRDREWRLREGLVQVVEASSW